MRDKSKRQGWDLRHQTPWPRDTALEQGPYKDATGGKTATRARGTGWESKWHTKGFITTRIHFIKNSKLKPGSPNLCISVSSS